MNANMAELLGAHAGDGTLYKTNGGQVWELRGGLDEKEYYSHISKVANSVLQIKTMPKYRSGGKNGCWGIRSARKDVAQFFTDHGFNMGSKTHSVRIPECILRSNLSIRRAFIRGLFDTDGCIRFDRINNNRLHTYPRVEFGFASKALRDELSVTLSDLGIDSFVWGKTDFRLCLAGKEKVTKFFKDISPKNVKHLNRLEFWSKYGHYVPYSKVQK